MTSQNLFWMSAGLCWILMGCKPSDPVPECPPPSSATRSAVVTDIDETLTTNDSEFIKQVMDPDYDPQLRLEADALMRDWKLRGYLIFYVTARGEDLSLSDGTSSTDATIDWLNKHGFPYEPSGVFLAPGFTATDAAEYKTEVLQQLQQQGYDLLYAYGNATTDIEAYQNVGIPNTEQFLVGELAGQLDVVGISNEDAYHEHRAVWPAAAPCGD